MSLFNYECDEVKRIIVEVSPNYPQLTTYEKEWIYFYKYGYIAGIPVDLEYQEVIVNPTGTVQNAIPYTYKSAVLKGQTLVNLFKNKDTYRDTGKFIYVEEGDKIQATFNDGVTNGWIGFSFKENVPFEIGKTYTVMNELYKCDDQLKSFNISFGNKTFTNAKPVIGINKFKITIPSDYTEGSNFMYYNVYNTNNSATIFSSNLLIIEGDYTQEDIPYFEGMKSVQMPVLTTTGKNLMPINSIVPKRWSNDNLNHKICDINLKPNTSYTFSNGFDGVSNTIRTRIYDDNNTLLVEVWGNQYKTFTTNTNKNYWVMAYDFGNGDVIKDIQIEEGTVKTSYEPYKSNILTTSEEVELRGIGDMRDELDCLTGQVTERIGEVILDGSEDWTLVYNTNDVRYNIYSMVLSDVDTTINNSLLNCLSDKVKTDKWSNINTNFTDKTFGLLSNRQLRVQFNGTLEELKMWLLSTKPTIQYIKTKSIKTVNLTKLPKPYEGTNHYHLTANIPCEAILEVPVVSTGEQTLQEINNY